jgi:hypothetical protein
MREHYFTDNECGGVREDRENTLASTPEDVNCSECIGMMYDQGVLS